MFNPRRFLVIFCVVVFICCVSSLVCHGSVLQTKASNWRLRQRADLNIGQSSTHDDHKQAIDSNMPEEDEAAGNDPANARPEQSDRGKLVRPVAHPRNEADEVAPVVNPARIERLPITNKLSSDYLFMYGDTPFYHHAPIYESGQHPTRVLEQAIRDHGTIYFITADGQHLHKYVRGAENVPSAHDLKGFWQLYSMGPQINHLYKVMKGLPAMKPSLHDSDFDHIPHWGSLPVFRYGEANVAQTYKAIRGPGGFLFMGPGTRKMRAYKFMMENDQFGFRRVESEEIESAIRKTLRSADASAVTYGPLLASLLHGKLIESGESSTHLPRYPKSLLDIPRFSSHSTRQQLVEAVQDYGKIRFYDMETNKKWEIKLPAGGELQIRKLGKMDTAAEQVSKSLGKLRMPT